MAGNATDESPRGQAPTTPWEYLGVGCFSMFVGLAGGGMIAVMIAKIVGALTQCAPDRETGAPCSWFVYAAAGALAGAVLVPSISIWFFRRGRSRVNNDLRG